MAHKWGMENIAIAKWGLPNAWERAIQLVVAHKWADWLDPPTLWRPQHFRAGWAKSIVTHKWADWLHNPCRMGGPQRFRAGDTMDNYRQVGGLAA